MATVLRGILLGVAALAALLLLTLALPVRAWRTGEMPVAPLTLEAGGPPVSLPRRVTATAVGRERGWVPGG